MMARARLLMYAATLALLAAVPAAAQERRGAIYVAGAVTVPYQNGVTGTVPETYETAPGGFSLGWSVAGGIFLHRRISLEGEFSRTGIMDAVEPSRYYMTFYPERRDQFITVGCRFHVRPASSFDIEPVAGFDIVVQQGWESTLYASPFRSPERASRWQVDGLPTAVGFSGGLDLRLGGRHFAAVPSIRVHRTYRPSETGSYWPGGFPTWTIRFSIGVRYDF